MTRVSTSRVRRAICAGLLLALAACGSDDDDRPAPSPIRVGDPSPSSGQWRPTGTMKAARAAHSATLLATGQVLVAGGAMNDTNLASAELYDPGTGQWTTTGSMRVARFGHTATMLPSGQVLVVGGDVNSTAEIYDPTTGTWTSTAPTTMPHIGGQTATLLASGRVLVAGGGLAAAPFVTAAAEIYDPAIGRWTPVGAMVRARLGHTATALPDGRVLVVGGQIGSASGNGPPTESTEIYDPVAAQWQAAASLGTARYEHLTTLLANGAIVVAGGFPNGPATELLDPTVGRWAPAGALPESHIPDTATLRADGTLMTTGGCRDSDGCNAPTAGTAAYDPVRRTWAPAPSLNQGRFAHSSTLLPSGRILIAGGIAVINDNRVVLGSSELYDPSPGNWTLTGSLATARSMHNATLLSNGQVLVAGGASDASFRPMTSAELYVFDASTRTGGWQPAGPMQLARINHTMTLLPNGLVLAAGGDAMFGVSSELYDPTTRNWQRTGDMNAQRFVGHTATLLNDGRVLVAGLCNSGPPYSAELFAYDQATRTGAWQITGSMNTPRCYHTATLLTSGQVVVAGGQDASLNSLASVEVYDPATGRWTNSAPLPSACPYGTARLLASGQVLFVCVGSAQVFTWNAQTSTGAWQSVGTLDRTRTLYSTTALLRDGRVMIAGGQEDGTDATSDAALFDPALGIWTTAAPMNIARQGHSTTLLPNGQLLSIGGNGSTASDVLRSAELYDSGLGFRPAWQPIVSLVAPLAADGALGIQGSLFRGLSEASGGDSLASSTAFPVVQLLRIDNGQSLFVPVDPFAGWSDTTFTSLPLAGFAPGPALVTVFTNGIPSASAIVVVQPSQPGR